MLQGFHTCNRACSQSSLKRSVIALLHVTVIHHRITLYKGYITPAASPAQHANQPVYLIIRWTVNGGFADMFLGSSNRVSWVCNKRSQTPDATASGALVAADTSAAASTSQSPETNVPETKLHRCSGGAVSAVSGPDSKSTEPGYTGLLYGVYGPVPGPARRGSKQCAKPALARFVTLLQRLCRTVVPRCQASLNRGTA